MDVGKPTNDDDLDAFVDEVATKITANRKADIDKIPPLEEFLAKLPPSFVEVINIGWLVTADPACVCWHAFGMVMKKKKEDRVWHAEQFFLMGMPNMLQFETLHDGLMKLGVGDLYAMRDYPRAGRTILGVIILVASLEVQSDSFLEGHIQSRKAFPSVPRDLLAALDMSFGCLLAMGALFVSGSRAMLRGVPWMESPGAPKWEAKLKAESAKLRLRIDSVAAELIAARPGPICVGGKNYDTAHSAVFSIADNVIDALRLASQPAGRAILSTKWPEESRANECVAELAAILSVPFTEYDLIQSSLRSEIVMAASRRAPAIPLGGAKSAAERAAAKAEKAAVDEADVRSRLHAMKSQGETWKGYGQYATAFRVKRATIEAAVRADSKLASWAANGHSSPAATVADLVGVEDRDEAALDGSAEVDRTKGRPRGPTKETAAILKVFDRVMRLPGKHKLGEIADEYNKGKTQRDQITARRLKDIVRKWRPQPDRSAAQV